MPHRDLHLTLQVNLLLRIQREMAPLEAMMLHPKVQPPLFAFAERYTAGGFRPIIMMSALSLLQRWDGQRTASHVP